MLNNLIWRSLLIIFMLPLVKVMATTSNINLNINHITIGQVNGNNAYKAFSLNGMGLDANPKAFSIFIEFTNQGEQLNNWQIGFYMPRVLYKAKKTNADIVMQICKSGGQNCSNLALKKTNFTESDLSYAFTTVLAPVSSYPLLKSTKYLIRILHSNQGQVLKYTSAPQSFFIIVNNQAINLATNKNIYTFLDYNIESVKQGIHQNTNSNWHDSSTITTDNMIIPTPANFRTMQGTTKITNNIDIINNMPNSNLVEDFIKNTLTNDLKVTINSHNKISNQITLSHVDLKKIKNNPEAYNLFIKNGKITIGANTNAGLFYGFITLRQILNQNKIHIPNLEIQDYPRFKYRGLLLDVARHYFTPNEIKQVIDIMATHKLNTLHLHLTDDEAFRLEIPNYPNLTAIGSTRGFNQKIIGTDLQQGNLNKQLSSANLPNINTKYGNFYTIDEMTDIIKYANLRAITIIPEIEIPVHARAMMKALPEIFYDEGDYNSFTGSNYNMLPVCKYDTNSQFKQAINQIILSTDKIFSQQSTVYFIPHEISVGGDEVSKYAWVNSPTCKDWPNLSALEKEHLFFNKLSSNSELKQIKFSGWHELVQNDDNSIDQLNLNSTKTGHIWVWKTMESGISSTIQLSNAGYNTITAFADLTYFDIAYSPDKEEPGFSWATNYSNTYTALKSSVATSAAIKNKTNKYPDKIFGIEGALWTDVIPDFDSLIYMALPKMAGLSEASWSREEITTNSDYPNWFSLTKRLGCGKTGFLAYLNAIYGVKYRGYPNGIALEAPKACKSNN